MDLSFRKIAATTYKESQGAETRDFPCGSGNTPKPASLEKGAGTNQSQDRLTSIAAWGEYDGAGTDISPSYTGLMDVPACSAEPCIAD